MTGHSKGGSIAQVAGVFLERFNPLAIALGNEPALYEGCSLLNLTRWFRSGNTRTDSRFGLLLYDMPFINFLLRFAYEPTFNYGYTFVMTDDDLGVASLGLNNQVKMGPTDRLSLARCHNFHSFIDESPASVVGYNDRILRLMANQQYPIRTTGFRPGFLFSNDLECASGRCGGISIWFFFSRRCL